MTAARRLHPAITAKWMKEHTPNLLAVFDSLLGTVATDYAAD